MKLDIGCGKNPVSGCFGIDRRLDVGADLVCDIEQGIPLADDSVNEVHMRHVLEHLVKVDVVLGELSRICQPGAMLYFVVPDVHHDSFHIPTHCQPWSTYWWENFAKPWMEIVNLRSVVDEKALALARKYLPGITADDAMVLLWNVRKELHITVRAR